MPAENKADKVAFQKDLADLVAQAAICNELLKDTRNKLKYMKKALERAEVPIGEFSKTVVDIETEAREIEHRLSGDPVKTKLDLDQPQNPMYRLGIISYEQKYSTSAPTKTHRDNYAIAKREIGVAKKELEELYNVKLKELEEALLSTGVPYTPGRGYENKD